MDLFLVRHGRSTWNNERRIQGHRNPPLAPQGKSSARELARLLKIRFGPYSVKSDVLIASPLSRARQTAGIISRALRLPLRIRLDLREACLGEWEGRTVDEIRRKEPKRLDLWYRSPTMVRLRGGEPIVVFRKRVRREILAILKKHTTKQRVILVTHGGWISTLLTDVVGIPLARMWTFVLDNSSLTRLHWDGKKLYLRSFNETAGPAVESFANRWQPRAAGSAGGTSSFRPPERLA